MKNSYRIEGDICYIELKRMNGDNLETMIDVDDFEIVNSISGTWHAHYNKNNDSFYCMAKNRIIVAYLHRFILGVKDRKVQVDHKYHNTLDNRRSELRLVTHTENACNRKNAKGYHYHKKHKKFRAQIRVNKKLIEIGHFDTEQEAHEAYLKAKKKYHKITEK